VEEAWAKVPGTPTAADVALILDQRCTSFEFATAKKQILIDEGDCGTDDTLTGPTIPARLAFYRSCEVDSLELGSAESFAVAAGEPQLSAALSRWLSGQGVSRQIAWEMALAIRGPALLPIDTGYTPARLPNSLPTATVPATRTVAKGHGVRVALGIDDPYSALIDALPVNDGAASVLGLSRDGKRVVELRGEVLRSGGYGRQHTLSVWLDVDGAHGFQSFDPVFGSAACPERAVCTPPEAEAFSGELGDLLASLTPEIVGRVGALVDIPAAQARERAHQGSSR
jgi:hypothetical protein